MKSHRKSKRGRPAKLTPAVRDAICKSIRAGNYFEPSCIRAGVSKSTAYNWLKRATTALERVAKSDKRMVTQDERPYVDFLDAVKKAEADSEARDVAIIRKAARAGHWQAAAWRLERKHYDRWGRRQAIEHSSPEGKPVRVQQLKIGDKIIEF